ncbi:MAG: hypothetical protein PHW86_05815, partial [Candidatus Bipolaricaulis sp.]|nr:hypothetical protein [Candidatus Bipolaricaulis sp.]
YTKEDTIDPAVGVELRKKVGESVEQGAPLTVLHVNREDHVAEAERMVAGAYTIDPSGAPHEPPPLIVERVTASQVPPRDAPENG